MRLPADTLDLSTGCCTAKSTASAAYRRCCCCCLMSFCSTATMTMHLQKCIKAAQTKRQLHSGPPKKVRCYQNYRKSPEVLVKRSPKVARKERALALNAPWDFTAIGVLNCTKKPVNDMYLHSGFKLKCKRSTIILYKLVLNILCVTKFVMLITVYDTQSCNMGHTVYLMPKLPSRISLLSKAMKSTPKPSFTCKLLFKKILFF